MQRHESMNNIIDTIENIENINNDLIIIDYQSKNLCKKMKQFINLVICLFGNYVFWIILHYISSHLYVKYCTPWTFLGFLQSPFTVAMPYCSGFRWVIVEGSNIILTMWFVLGSWLLSNFIKK